MKFTTVTFAVWCSSAIQFTFYEIHHVFDDILKKMCTFSDIEVFVFLNVSVTVYIHDRGHNIRKASDESTTTMTSVLKVICVVPDKLQ